MMCKRRAVLICTGWVFLAAAFCGRSLGAEPKKKEQLPGFPKGVKLGMDVKALLKLRPNIKSNSDMKLGEINFAKGTHSLYENRVPRESRRSGDLLYTIMDGRCVGFGFLDVYTIVNPIRATEKARLKASKEDKDTVYDMETFAARRASTLVKYHKLLGGRYARWLSRQGTGKVSSYLIPSFVWRGENKKNAAYVALTMTSDYVGVDFSEVVIRALVWDQSKIDIACAFDRKPKAKLVAAIFGPLEKELKKKDKGGGLKKEVEKGKKKE